MDQRASATLLALLCLGQGAIREAEAQVPTTGNEPSIEQALACPVGIAAPSECLVRVQGRTLSIVSKMQGQET